MGLEIWDGAASSVPHLHSWMCTEAGTAQPIPYLSPPLPRAGLDPRQSTLTLQASPIPFFLVHRDASFRLLLLSLWPALPPDLLASEHPFLHPPTQKEIKKVLQHQLTT